ncbi:MAG: substrate-binding domain-containing protein [Pseudomonadota bacterium]
MHFVFLGEDDDDFTRGGRRREGFIAAMTEAGLSGERVFRVGRPPLSIEDGAAATSAILERFPDVDCIFCVSDMPAFGVQSTLLARGFAVPDDIGVAGFGNFEVSRFASPQISTVVTDPTLIGRQAGELIARLLASDATECLSSQIDAAPVLDLRGSTKRRA